MRKVENIFLGTMLFMAAYFAVAGMTLVMKGF